MKKIVLQITSFRKQTYKRDRAIQQQLIKQKYSFPPAKRKESKQKEMYSTFRRSNFDYFAVKNNTENLPITF